MDTSVRSLIPAKQYEYNRSKQWLNETKNKALVRSHGD